MSGIQPVTTRHRSATTLLAALPGASVSPLARSEGEDVQPNQVRIEILELGETTWPSQSDNLTFDPNTVAESFNKLAPQQIEQKRQNHKLFDLVERLTEEIDS